MLTALLFSTLSLAAIHREPVPLLNCVGTGGIAGLRLELTHVKDQFGGLDPHDPSDFTDPNTQYFLAGRVLPANPFYGETFFWANGLGMDLANAAIKEFTEDATHAQFCFLDRSQFPTDTGDPCTFAKISFDKSLTKGPGATGTATVSIRFAKNRYGEAAPVTYAGVLSCTAQPTITSWGKSVPPGNVKSVNGKVLPNR
jgi:hypothetical protein